MTSINYGDRILRIFTSSMLTSWLLTFEWVPSPLLVNLVYGCPLSRSIKYVLTSDTRHFSTTYKDRCFIWCDLAQSWCFFPFPPKSLCVFMSLAWLRKYGLYHLPSDHKIIVFRASNWTRTKADWRLAPKYHVTFSSVRYKQCKRENSCRPER